MEDIKELLARIDERTLNIDKRQVEEIEERKKLSDRVSILENWRNYLAGGYAALVAGGIGLFREMGKH